MKQLIAWLILACVCFGQDPNSTIEQNSTLPVEQIVLPWHETGTNEFSFNGTTELIDHLRDHPMLGDELEKLHEWLHQRVERLRPKDAYSFIVVEATDAQFNAWADRGEIEAAGWKIIRTPVRNSVKNVVAIGKTHFSHAGYLSKAALQRFVNQVENRKVAPLKNARARWVSSIKMYTRGNCTWCDKWMANECPQVIAEGVDITFITDPNGSVPRFDVCDSSGTCRQYVGFTAWAKMRDVQ